MCGGTFIGPVGTTREASNMVQSGFPVPPLHVRCAPLLVENAPELLALKESAPSCPVMLRISSRPQAPAWPIPSTQFRKRARLFENSIGLNGFFAGLRPFRNWVLGQSQNAGMYKADVFKAHHHDTKWNPDRNPVRGSGGSVASLPRNDAKYANDVVYGYNGDTVYSFMADSGGAETAPCHIYQPVILYLGRPR